MRWILVEQLIVHVSERQVVSCRVHKSIQSKRWELQSVLEKEKRQVCKLTEHSDFQPHDFLGKNADQESQERYNTDGCANIMQQLGLIILVLSVKLTNHGLRLVRFNLKEMVGIGSADEVGQGQS
jgi:hypothetical protein